MGTYVTNPNQRMIDISPERLALCDNNHLYLRVQKKCMFDAMNDLTPTNFLVWLYISSQKHEHTFAFSPAAISQETGIKKSALQEGIRVLIDHNYLVKRENSNIYDFYQIPKTKEENEEPDTLICPHTDNKEDSGFRF